MHILFGKKKSSKELSKPTFKLPPNFAQEVLALEEQVNINCTHSTITRLLSLYTQAIECYEAEKNLKHLHYQERMQSLLSKTNVIIQLSTSPSPVPSPKTVPSPKVTTPKNVLVLERTCNKVLSDHKSENFGLVKKIQENLKNQSDNLAQRLLTRKLAQTPKHTKSKFNFEETSQFDISAGEVKINCVEEFENNVESILEKFLIEKEKEKRIISDKYLEYFEEIDRIKGDVKEKLVKELSKNLEKELDKRMKEIDERRQNEIARARRKFFKETKFKF